MELPLGTIAARWESTHEDGRPMVAEDVPSYKIVNGELAEPLLTRIVNRETGEQRWRLVKAAPLRGPAGELMAVSVIEDVTEAKEAELRQRFLAQAGVTLASSLDYEETLQRVAQLAVPWLADWCAVDVADGNERLQQVAVAHVDPDKIAFAREFRSRYPPDPERRRAASTACCARGARSSTPRSPRSCSSRASRTPSSCESILALGMRSVMLIPMVVAGRTHRRPDDGVGRERARVRRGRPRVRGRPRAPRRDRGRERAPVHRARPGRAHAPGEPAARAAAEHRRAGELASSYAAGDTTVEVGGDFFDVVELESGLPGRGRRRHRQGRAGRGADRARPLHAGHRRALRPEPRGGRAACSTTSSSIARRSRCSPWRARTSSRAPRARACASTSAGHPPPVLSRPGQRADDRRAARAAAGR